MSLVNSIGSSAERWRNNLATYYEALKFLDRRFQQFRQKSVDRMEGEPAAQAVALRVINNRWTKARLELKRALLPQKDRAHNYRPVRTVNPTVGGEKKVKPRNSLVQRQLRGGTRKQRRKGGLGSRDGRSHHKGKYSPINVPVRRGRPRTVSLWSPERQKAHRKLLRAKRRAADRAATDKDRRGRNWREYPFPRRTPEEVKAHRDAMKKYSWAIWTARIIVGGLRHRWIDQRHNHDKFYGYSAPVTRKRATSAQASLNKHCKRDGSHGAGGRHGKPHPSGMLARILASAKKSKHMRGYWRQVHDYTQILWRHRKRPEKYRS